MDAQRIAGIVLVIAGVLALAYGGFSYTSQTHETDIGPLSLSFSERERVNVPIWAGVSTILLGGVLLVWRRKV